MPLKSPAQMALLTEPEGASDVPGLRILSSTDHDAFTFSLAPASNSQKQVRILLHLHYGGLVLTTAPGTSDAKKTFISMRDVIGATLQSHPDDLSILLNVHLYTKQSPKWCGVGAKPRHRMYQKLSFLIRRPLLEHGSPVAGDSSMTYRESVYEPLYALASEWGTAITRLALGLGLTNESSRNATQASTTATKEQQGKDRLPFTHFASDIVSPMPTIHIKVILSPVSGPGRALETWNTLWGPMFDHANIQYSLQLTERRAHATEIVGQLRLLDFDGVVAVGGDGMIHEVVQGLLTRSDWRVARRHLPVGVLPGGSGNGIARGFCAAANEVYDNISAGFILIKSLSAPRAMDAASVIPQLDPPPRGPARVLSSTPLDFDPQHRLYTVHNTEWGTIADIDIESERCRFFGAERFTMQGIVRAFGLRRYSGRISYLPARTRTSTHVATDYGTLTTEEENTLLSADAPGAFSAKDGPDLQLLPSAGGPLQKSDGWETIEGQFGFVWILQTTHQSVDICNSPESEIDDGLFYILYTLDPNEITMAMTLLQMNEDGGGAKSNLTNYVACEAFRIEPGSRIGGCCKSSCCCFCRPCRPCCDFARAHYDGYVAVDGERFEPFGSLQGEIHPGLLRAFALPFDLQKT